MRGSEAISVLTLVFVLTPAALVALAGATEGECAWEGGDKLNQSKEMSALVLGGTGAVGHQLVQQLLASDQWSKVVTISRREVSLPAGQAGADKLKQVVMNLDDLQKDEKAQAAFKGVDAVFCALGTTRGAAGTADAFRKVDYDYVAAAASAAKAAGVPYFGLVSAQGANSLVPACDFRLLHPLLYTQTKGRAEDVVRKQDFSRAAIFRPGMLNRGDRARMIEKVFSPVLGSIPVSDVAKVMIADAQAFKEGQAHGGNAAVFEMWSLKKAAKTGQPPKNLF